MVLKINAGLTAAPDRMFSFLTIYTLGLAQSWTSVEISLSSNTNSDLSPNDGYDPSRPGRI